MEKLLIVEGMSCGHCKKSVEESLGKLDGINSVEVNLDTKEVLVKGDNIDEKAIETTIDNIGFDLVEIK